MVTRHEPCSGLTSFLWFLYVMHAQLEPKREPHIFFTITNHVAISLITHSNVIIHNSLVSEYYKRNQNLLVQFLWCHVGYKSHLGIRIWLCGFTMKTAKRHGKNRKCNKDQTCDERTYNVSCGIN